MEGFQSEDDADDQDEDKVPSWFLGEVSLGYWPGFVASGGEAEFIIEAAVGPWEPAGEVAYGVGGEGGDEEDEG